MAKINIRASTIGYPRIGLQREMKKCLEDYWNRKIDYNQLLAGSRLVYTSSISDMINSNIDIISVGSHTLYDNMLDWAMRFGLIHPRFLHLLGYKFNEKTGKLETFNNTNNTMNNGYSANDKNNSNNVKKRLDTYFAMARGVGGEGGGECDGEEYIAALDMTKWFDTNYHNLTPEIDRHVFSYFDQIFDWSDFIAFLKDAICLTGGKRVGVEIIGPLTLALKSNIKDISIETFLDKLVDLYIKLFEDLKCLDVFEIQMNEPILVVENARTEKMQKIMTSVYARLYKCLTNTDDSTKNNNIQLNLVTFFDDIGDDGFDFIINMQSIHALSLDFTRGNNLHFLKKYAHKIPTNIRLNLGILDGRSVWTDEDTAPIILYDILSILSNAEEKGKEKREEEEGNKTVRYENLKHTVHIQPSCSLMFLPLDFTGEKNLVNEWGSKLHFARQKLCYLNKLRNIARDGEIEKLVNEIKEEKGGRVKIIDDDEGEEPEEYLLKRKTPYEQRRQLQLKEETLLTSTIGSFPQTSEMRRIRLKFRKKEISEEAYQRAVDNYIAFCIGAQEGIGLDVLVHGEPERSDMVEYFAEKMNGFLFTTNGWVQSYGSRYVRPPIIVGDISRRNGKAMTVREYEFAQSLTDKKVKGMLTGAITILNWSFICKHTSRKVQAYQVAKALREEVNDLQKAGCKVIQVDEPALREGLPLNRKKQSAYLRFAVNAFRLVTGVANDDVHVVTHFCYSDFQDVLNEIIQMDADQITMENSRSDGAMLDFIRMSDYCHDLGVGIYDVHSPAIPSVESFERRIMVFAKNLKKQKEEGTRKDECKIRTYWVVPDCGLKTRKWDEVINALRNCVQATRNIKTKLAI